jgi:hypothetical protein
VILVQRSRVADLVDPESTSTWKPLLSPPIIPAVSFSVTRTLYSSSMLTFPVSKSPPFPLNLRRRCRRALRLLSSSSGTCREASCIACSPSKSIVVVLNLLAFLYADLVPISHFWMALVRCWNSFSDIGSGGSRFQGSSDAHLAAHLFLAGRRSPRCCSEVPQRYM